MTSQSDRERDEPPQVDETGFTIIELIVVIGIIGILLGVMIPTLLQARVPAQDRQAQNLLRNSLTAAKAIETSDGNTATMATLALEEGGVTFVDDATTAPANRRNVSVANVSFGSTVYVILASQSTSQRCFAILETTGGTPLFQRLDDPPTCDAGDFDPLVGWVDKWP